MHFKYTLGHVWASPSTYCLRKAQAQNVPFHETWLKNFSFGRLAVAHVWFHIVLREGGAKNNTCRIVTLDRFETSRALHLLKAFAVDECTFIGFERTNWKSLQRTGNSTPFRSTLLKLSRVPMS